MRTDHVNMTPTLSTTVYIMSILFLPFSPRFSSFVCINCHISKCTQTTWTVHQHCQHQCLSVYSFSLFFPLTLWLYLCYLPYVEMHTDHVYSTPTLSITVYIMSIPFFSFFFWVLAIFVGLSSAPPYSCRNPVIPVEFRWIPVEWNIYSGVSHSSGIPLDSGIYTGMFPGMGRNRIPVELFVCLFVMYLCWITNNVCLWLLFSLPPPPTHTTTDNDRH